MNYLTFADNLWDGLRVAVTLAVLSFAVVSGVMCAGPKADPDMIPPTKEARP